MREIGPRDVAVGSLLPYAARIEYGFAGRDRLGYRADPHGAVAAAVLERALAPGEAGVFLATAHPAKFDATSAGIPLPEPLARAMARPLATESLPDDPARLAAALRARS